jgi:hypothetical protein
MTEQETTDKLLMTIKSRMAELEELDVQVNGHWGGEDLVYRYYHHSFKVFYIQGLTQSIVTMLQELRPELPLNQTFMSIVSNGTGKTFDLSDNARWDEVTQPMLQAFFHAKYFLDMVIKYGKKLEKAPNMLPSGWATVLYLYGMR